MHLVAVVVLRPWYKSNALIDTNAPYEGICALLWTINQLTDGLPQFPYRKTRKGGGVTTLLEPDEDTVECF